MTSGATGRSRREVKWHNSEIESAISRDWKWYGEMEYFDILVGNLGFPSGKPEVIVERWKQTV